jgi:hypothetical protein
MKKILILFLSLLILKKINYPKLKEKTMTYLNLYTLKGNKIN